MTAIDNNNPDVYWFTGGSVGPIVIGAELWQVAMQATTWGANTIDVQTAPIGSGTWTTVHTFSANGVWVNRYNSPGGTCQWRTHVNGSNPTGIRQALGRIPEPDQSDTITGSVTAAGTGLSTGAALDGGSYTLAGTVTVAATDLNVQVTPFEDSIGGLPTAVVPVATGVAVGAFSFSGVILPKAFSTVIQAVNTASGVSFTLTKDIGDNRRCQSNTLRFVPNGAGNPITFDNGLYMFLADANTWTTGTVALEADLGSGYVSIAPDLDNTAVPQTLAVVSGAGATAPFRFHPSTTIAGLVCAYAQIPVDAVDDAPAGTLNTGSGLSLRDDVTGGTYALTINVHSIGSIGNNSSQTGTTNAPGANELFLVKATSPITQTLTNVSCIPAATSAGAKFKAVVYPDSSGSPNGQSLIATGAEVVGATSGTAVTSAFATPPTLTAGQSYWIGFITNVSVALTQFDINTLGVKAANTYTGGAPATCPTVTTGQPDWEIWGATGTGNTDAVVNWSPHGAAAGSNLTLPVLSFLGANSSGGNTGHGDYSGSIQVPPGQIYITSSNGNTTVNVGGDRTQGD